MDTQQPFDINAPASIGSFFNRLFQNDFMPHGHCYFWRPDVLWLNVLSDASIVVAYYAIPMILLYFIRKRNRDVPFPAIFYLFSAFIFLCGTTHLMEIITTWQPAYRLEGIVKLVTGIVSIWTVIALTPVIPKAIAMPRLFEINEQLRAKAEALQKANASLARFNHLAVGREAKMMDLKQEVNGLLMRLGEEPKYESPS